MKLSNLSIDQIQSLIVDLQKELKSRVEETQFEEDPEDRVSMYLPRVPKNFYFDPNVFRRLLGIK